MRTDEKIKGFLIVNIDWYGDELIEQIRLHLSFIQQRCEKKKPRHFIADHKWSMKINTFYVSDSSFDVILTFLRIHIALKVMLLILDENQIRLSFFLFFFSWRTICTRLRAKQMIDVQPGENERQSSFFRSLFLSICVLL